MTEIQNELDKAQKVIETTKAVARIMAELPFPLNCAAAAALIKSQFPEVSLDEEE